MKQVIYLLTIALLACGGKSDPLLTAAKLELKGKRLDGAYTKLSKGLYSEAGKNKNLKSIPEAWLEMGKLHAEKKEYKKMHAAFTKVKELEAADKEKKFSKAAENFVKASGNQNYNASVKIYNDALKISDENAQMKKFKEALTRVDNAISFDQSEAAYYSLRAQQRGVLKVDGAEGDYKKSLELKPDDANTIKSLGFYYFNHQKYDLAAEKLNEALKHDATNSDMLKYRSYAYQNAGKYDKAIASYKEWQKLEPNNTSISASLTPLYYATKDYQKAIESATEAINNDPNCDKSQYTYMANSYFTQINELNKEKKRNEAKALASTCLALLEKGIETETHKENGEIWKYMSYVYATLGKSKLAKKAERQAKKFGED